VTDLTQVDAAIDSIAEHPGDAIQETPGGPGVCLCNPYSCVAPAECLILPLPSGCNPHYAPLCDFHPVTCSGDAAVVCSGACVCTPLP
jgi:hypothetical protein